MRDIGKNIKTARLHQKLTQDQLAEKIHTTRQTVSNYETGKSHPDLDMLVILAQALGCDIHQLIYGGDDRARKKKHWTKAVLAAAMAMLFGVLFTWLYPIALRNFQTGDWGGQIAFSQILKWAAFVCIGFSMGSIVSIFFVDRCKSADIVGGVSRCTIIILLTFAALYSVGIPMLYIGGTALYPLRKVYMFLWRSDVFVPLILLTVGVVLSAKINEEE